MSHAAINFDDPDAWEVIPDVTVFDEHEERDADGKVIEKFDKARLERIAANCNAREEKKNLPCPLVIGHMARNIYADDGKALLYRAREEDQPEIVGYARKHRVTYDSANKRHVIRCTYYIRKEKADEAKTYPRTSVELYKNDDFFDPIALIRRTPRRDVGQWTYARPDAGPDQPYRYEVPEMDPVSQPNAADPEMDMIKKIEEVVRQILPGMLQEAITQAAGAAGGGMGGPPGGAPQAAGMPGQDAGGMPGQFAKPAAATPQVRDGQSDLYAKLTADLARVDAERKALADRYARSECERICDQLKDYYAFDRNSLVARLMPLDDAGREAVINEVRQYHREAPVGGMVRTAAGVGRDEHANPAGGRPPFTDAHLRLAQQYMRDNHGKAAGAEMWKAAEEYAYAQLNGVAAK